MRMLPTPVRLSSTKSHRRPEPPPAPWLHQLAMRTPVQGMPFSGEILGTIRGAALSIPVRVRSAIPDRKCLVSRSRGRFTPASGARRCPSRSQVLGGHRLARRWYSAGDLEGLDLVASNANGGKLSTHDLPKTRADVLL